MFSSKHYVPAIRWRQGEYLALQELTDAQRRRMTPLVDIPPVPWDYEEDAPSKTIDQHLARVPDQMERAWGLREPIFIDLGLLDPEVRTAGGLHPLNALFRLLEERGVRTVPVTGSERDNDYQTAVRDAAARNGRGAAIRLTPDDVSEDDLMDRAGETREIIQTELDETDLILDFGNIQADQVGLVSRLAGNAIRSIPDVNDYRSLTLLSGAFPINLADVTPGLGLIPRADWDLWLQVRTRARSRIPAFGDYTATHPDQQEMDPRIMQMSASIRYATESHWLIARGRSVRSPRFGGFSQFNDLARLLTQQPQFTGHRFSWASDFIEACAAGGPTGNPATWRKVATNRHMVLVVHQIANLA
jgi:hypothetical protein